MNRKRWTRDELILVMNLYCRLPFGKMHYRNQEITLLANHIGRSPSAVAMKLVNFASFDPALKERGVKGLGNAAKSDFEIWSEFNKDWETLSFESQKAFMKINDITLDQALVFNEPKHIVETEVERITRVRLVQGFFRSSILASYKEECSFCGTNLCELLNASHIIPWSKSVERRADPTNGICLCAFHDRAFDRGLMGIGRDMEIIVSPTAKMNVKSSFQRVGILEIEGKPITLPEKFCPDPKAIDFHRSEIFRN